MDSDMVIRLHRHACRLIVLAPDNPASHVLCSSVLLRMLLTDSAHIGEDASR